MILGAIPERVGHTRDDACIYDPPSPFITFSVVDPANGHTGDYGKRGQVVMNHVSKNMLLPNNLERDLATRIEPQAGPRGHSAADGAPPPPLPTHNPCRGA